MENKNIEVVNGNGSNLDISDAYDHISAENRSTNSKKPKNIVIPTTNSKKDKNNSSN